MKYTVIGSSSLTFECIKYLYQNSYPLSVISDHLPIQNWCRQQGVPIAMNIKEYKTPEDDNTILLSIVNYQILPKDFVEKFDLAINYHDSALPKYAGMYATTWALLNNESTHGISWHIIEEMIDTGDILLSKPIEIEAEETVHSLNLKCTNKALSSLPELLKITKDQKFTAKKQDLSQRTLYCKDCTFFAHALFSLEDSLDSIDRVCRAFAFPSYLFNPLSLPKININQQTFIFQDCLIKNPRIETYNRLSIKKGDLFIDSIMNAYGKTLTKEEFFKRAKLDSNSCVTLHHKKSYELAKKEESRWHHELTHFKSLDHQILTPCEYVSSRKEVGIYSVEQVLKAIADASWQEEFSILYSDQKLLDFSQKHFELYSALIPITIRKKEKFLSGMVKALMLTDLFPRSGFHKTPQPVLILSKNIELLEKIPFHSYVFLLFAPDNLHIFEHNAKLNISISTTLENPEIKSSESNPCQNLVDHLPKASVQVNSPYILEDENWYTRTQILEQTHRLAHFFLEQGIKKADMVGLGIPTGVPYLISLLALARIGATYVPLDPNYPLERLLYIVKDTGLKHILTIEKHVKTFHFPLVTTHVFEAVKQQLYATYSTELDLKEPQPLPLYAIYTSGTTGAPKGVLISHENVISSLQGTLKLLNLEKKRFIAVTSTSFDIHLFDYLLPMCSEGQVIVAPQETIRDGKQLRILIEKHKINAMQATPMTWKMLIESGWMGFDDFLMICCGEPLSSDLASQLLKRGTLYNLYGPTEATIYASGVRIYDPKKITIGPAIAGADILIVDEKHQLLEQGKEGQIAIGGKGVAIEYINQPHLTAEKFIPHPIYPKERLYLTGDLGKELENGYIDCLGRRDYQVKINGHRIELQEIEEVLKQSVSIKNIVVLLENSCFDTKKIVAYIEVPKNLISPSTLTTKLRQQAKRKLAPFMLPHQYICVDKFPLMLSGKVDRQKLSEIRQESIPEKSDLTDIEKEILSIWEKLLNTTVLQIQEDFFSLGGNSLLAIRLTNQLAEKFNIEIEYTDLIELTTIEKQANFIESLHLCQS